MRTEPHHEPTTPARRDELRERLAAMDGQIRLKLAYELRDRSEVDDWTQTIHLRVLQRIENGEDFENFEAWVRGFIPFALKEQHRRLHREHKLLSLESDEGGEFAPAVSAALERIEHARLPDERDAMRVILDDCVAALAESEHTMYLLRWGPDSDRLTSAAVAERLATTVAAIDKRASRIRKKLEECCRAGLERAQHRSGMGPSLHLAS